MDSTLWLKIQYSLLFLLFPITLCWQLFNYNNELLPMKSFLFWRKWCVSRLEMTACYWFSSAVGRKVFKHFFYYLFSWFSFATVFCLMHFQVDLLLINYIVPVWHVSHVFMTHLRCLLIRCVKMLFSRTGILAMVKIFTRRRTFSFYAKLCKIWCIEIIHLDILL